MRVVYIKNLKYFEGYITLKFTWKSFVNELKSCSPKGRGEETDHGHWSFFPHHLANEVLYNPIHLTL